MFTYVLSGGGARGAYQAGALLALAEAGYRPELLVGTSIGAVNASYLALNGTDPESVQGLAQLWRDAREIEVLTSNRTLLAVRALMRMPDRRYYERVRELYIAHGLTPDLRFGELTHARLIVVSADLNSGRPVLYGTSPDHKLLDAVLASSAIPPWIPPIETDGRLLTDGGLVSNLPIEPAISQGATEIIALDLFDARGIANESTGVADLISKAYAAASRRQIFLELALAEAKNVPVRRVPLHADQMITVSVWDFSQVDRLVEEGYEIARKTIEEWQSQILPWWQQWWQTLQQILGYPDKPGPPREL